MKRNEFNLKIKGKNEISIRKSKKKRIKKLNERLY